MESQNFSVRSLLMVVALVVLRAATVYGQSPENVAVVINTNSPDSVRVGEYYTRKRAVPPSNIFRIQTSTEESIERAAYTRTIAQPMAAALSKADAQDRILYLVLTKGIPIRITGTVGATGTVASVDSELTLLYRSMTGARIPLTGYVANPYFLGDRDIRSAKAFSHRDHDIYLVSRLDAFTVDEAIALVDKGAAPAKQGRFVLDQRDALTNRVAENWLAEAATRLRAGGDNERVLLESTVKPARDIRGVIGYFSWGSVDPENRVRNTGLAFAPGAIAAEYVGTDARTFRPPPDTWTPMANPNNRSTWYSGSPESLIADLVRDGATGVAGQVAEPFLQGLIRPHILFPAYAAGFNLIEAFYLAIPNLSWQTIVIGDPLCAPFTGRQAAVIDGSLDQTTLLPMNFSRRTVAGAAQRVPGIAERAIALSVRADVLLNRGDERGSRTALSEAVQIAPGFWAALLKLATLEQSARQYDAAIEKYRRVLDLQPNQAVALNNLAYALAVFRNRPDEALPFAERAAKLSPNELNILDTLGWVRHLSGDDTKAAQVFTRITRSPAANAEVHLHAAVVFAAVGQRMEAETALAAALKLDPMLEQNDAVKQVRAQLGKSVPPR